MHGRWWHAPHGRMGACTAIWKWQPDQSESRKPHTQLSCFHPGALLSCVCILCKFGVAESNLHTLQLGLDRHMLFGHQCHSSPLFPLGWLLISMTGGSGGGGRAKTRRDALIQWRNEDTSLWPSLRISIRMETTLRWILQRRKISVSLIYDRFASRQCLWILHFKEIVKLFSEYFQKTVFGSDSILDSANDEVRLKYTNNHVRSTFYSFSTTLYLYLSF